MWWGRGGGRQNAGGVGRFDPVLNGLARDWRTNESLSLMDFIYKTFRLRKRTTMDIYVLIKLFKKGSL